MQPYLFPYIGYFQLAAAVDRFVFLDDVAFIKRGWIHRNRLLVNGAPYTFTVPVRDASQNRSIDSTEVHEEAFAPNKLLKTIELAYRKAPHFPVAFALAENVFCSGLRKISDLAKLSVRSICAYLQVKAEFVETSAAYANADLKGPDRIRDICIREHASHYVNPPGGTDLYDPASFVEAGVRLHFLQPREQSYPQFGAPFTPWLSMLDVLMFNSQQRAAELLQGYDLKDE